MKRLNQISLVLFLCGSLVFFNACKKDEVSSNDFGIFFSQDGTTAIMNGEITSNTPQHWDNYVASFPSTNKIIMKNCPGSFDDVANLKAARKVKTQNVAIHLPADAEIASGAVDFFFAGASRTREAGSKIGVHSWSDGSKEATDFAVGHSNHQPYIDYYIEMGLSQEEAESFYYFTINAAPAADVHWMTEAEIAQYKLLKP